MSNNSSSYSSNLLGYCAVSQDLNINFTAYIITRTLLLLPLSIFVLHLGHRQWLQQRSFATTSHSDIFTFHMVALEMIFVLSITTFLCGYNTLNSKMMHVGTYLSNLIHPGQVCFHILTCVERYLAVIHPVMYLKLRQSGGVRIRNISIVCVWLFTLSWAGLMSVLIIQVANAQFIWLLIISLIIVSFCSLRVLCVLIRPGPGEVGGNRDRVDQSKQKAFHTIAAILAVLWLWFAAVIVAVALEVSNVLEHEMECVLHVISTWFNLPSSLVLPLLFLHRAGKLVCFH